MYHFLGRNMIFFYVWLSSFYFNINLNRFLKSLFYGVLLFESSTYFMSYTIKNSFKTYKKSTCSILEQISKGFETKINDNALAFIALLIIQSQPNQKEIIIKLVMNMLYEGEV